MTARKRIGIFLVVCGLLILGTAGFLWRRDAPELDRLKAERVMLEDSLARVHDRLVQTSLRQQGFHKSKENMPDSVRLSAAGQIKDVYSEYTKKIRVLEQGERDVKLKISAVNRRTTRIRERARATGTPVVAGGLAVLLAGVVVVLLPARRVGA